MFAEENQPIDLKNALVDLSAYRPCPALRVYIAYARDDEIYQNGRITVVDAATYQQAQPNERVNKFGRVYAGGHPMLLHRRLADVLIDSALDLYAHYGYITVVMDGLRTFESGMKMQENRPDLVQAGLLAPAGSSAHNRALAVDSKLFVQENGALVEVDEHGHLDDLDMATNSRFYQGEMSGAARANRLWRLQAWQRASVRSRLPIANLLAEFWDDRVPGSPADLWRVLACRALCVGVNGNPASNPVIARLKQQLNALHARQEAGASSRDAFAHAAQAAMESAWDAVFTPEQRRQMDELLGQGGGSPPALEDYVFHEWLQTIHDDALEAAFGFRQTM